MDATIGVVITGGTAPTPGVLQFPATGALIVAADSGLDTARRYGVKPDAIVGDMDSVSDRALLDDYPDAEVRRHDRAKDFTDTELAIDYVAERGVSRVVLVGGGGGRLDHLMSVIRLFERARRPSCWLTDRDQVVAVEGVLEFEAPPDRIVSFFPVGSDPVRARTLGLRWPLDRLEWGPADFGVSNECEDVRCRVEMLSGRLLMVHALPPQVAIR